MSGVLGSWSFVDYVDTSATPNGWDLAIVPGGFKYTSKHVDACATIVRVAPNPDVDIKDLCGGSIPLGTCIVHVGSVAAVVKP